VLRSHAPASERGDGYRFAKRQGKPNSANPAVIQQNSGFCDFARRTPRVPFRFDSLRCLNCSSNLIGHDHPDKPANGDGDNGTSNDRTGAALGGEAANKKRRDRMFQGQFDFETAKPVDASAIPDVLFERGMYWSSGRSGIVDLVAAHKWFNLAALKGRVDAIALRREVAEMMSEVEIAMAQRAARAWITTH
jgi:hypothetical protein